MPANKNNSYTFSIDPNADILTNLIQCMGDYAVQGIFSRFNPFDSVEDFLKKGKIDTEAMFSYEDITWDTVFAKMKTFEFANGASESGKPINDMSFYMDYTDMIHDIDTDALVDKFGDEAIATAGYICMEIWNQFRIQLMPELLESDADYNKLIAKLKDSVGPLIINAINKYLKEGDDVVGGMSVILSSTNEVFDKLSHDEIGLFKMVFASVVKGTEVMICNPEYLQLGDRIKSAIKYYVSGASVAVSDKMMEKLSLETFEKLSVIAPGLIEYIPTIISSMLSCAVIITLDKNPVLIRLIDEFNEIPTITGNIALYRESAEKFEILAAKLVAIDIEELKREIEFYDSFSAQLEKTTDPKDLNEFLLNYYKTKGLNLPWGNRSIEEHWEDKNSRLVFK